LSTRHLLRLLLVSFLLAPCLQVCSQEVTATLLGAVTDSTAARIPNAEVSITNTDRRALERRVHSDGRGEFIAPLLPVGHYSVRVVRTGFKELERNGIELHVGDKVTLTLQLSPGSTSEQVTVTADALQVQLQSPSEEGLVSGTEIRELSINNRNFLGLLSILPGVTSTSASDELSIGAVNPTGGVNSLTFSLNGGRTSGNQFLLDGADNVDRGANGTLINTPSVDAVAEFKAIRGVYSAEYGHNASSQINVITRSGESQFHGTAYEFFRNDVLAANNAYNNLVGIRRPPLRYNDFGYTFSGPVFVPNHYNTARDKTFFFFSQEFRRVIQYSTQTGIAPTNAMKAGTFLHPVCVAYTTPAGTTCTATSTQITTFDPVAAEYIKDVFSPLPEGDPANALRLVSNGRLTFNLRQEFARIDHQLTRKHAVTVRYIRDGADTQEPYGYQVSSLIPFTATTATQTPGMNVLGRLTSTLTSSAVNELAFAYTGGRKYSLPIGLLSKNSATDVNVNLPFQSTLGNVPYLSMTGLSPLRGYGAYTNESRNYNIFDNFTLARGRHTLKVGFTYNYYQKTENNASTNAGSFSFGATTLPAGGATNAEQTFANFLLGQHATFTQTSLDLTPDIRQNESEVYVQDDFRWTPRLTVNGGLRYSQFRTPFDSRHMLSNFDPAKFDITKAPTLTSAGAAIVAGSGDPLNGIIINGTTSPYGNKVSNEPGGRFAPRVGFSFDPYGSGRMAVRGGYGLVFDSTLVGIYENNIFTNPAFLNNLSVTNATFADPGGGVVGTSIAALRGTPLPTTLPYTQMYSLDVQQQIGNSFVLDVGYYGSKATHLLGIVDINTLQAGQAVAAGTMTANTPLTSGTTPKAVNALRPYRGYTAINVVENWFGSNYSSLQVSAQKKLADGSSLRLAYTFQKTLTDAGTDRNSAPQDQYNIHSEYSRAPFDRAQILVLSYVYKLPLYKDSRGFAHKVLYGWELSGITSFDAGLATVVTSGAGRDWAGVGVLGSSSQVTIRPDRIGDPNSGAPHTLNKWFNTAAYANVPVGQVRLGNARPTSLVGPGFEQWDISLFRNVSFTERWKLQIRAESFNAFNHTNPATLNTSGTSTDNAAFGQVTAVREPRRIQLGAKILF